MTLGASVDTDICDNVVRVGDHRKLSDALNDLDKGEEFENGWVRLKSSVRVGRKKRLYADEFIKDNGARVTVYVVNESPYAAGGGVSYAVFGPDKEGVQMFVREALGWKKFKVEAQDSVQQTL